MPQNEAPSVAFMRRTLAEVLQLPLVNTSDRAIRAAFTEYEENVIPSISRVRKLLGV